MKPLHEAVGRKVFCGEDRLATADTPEIAKQLAKLLNRAHKANGERHYTQSARLNLQADTMAGVSWRHPEHFPRDPEPMGVNVTHGCHECGEERRPRIVAGKLTCPECGSDNILAIEECSEPCPRCDGIDEYCPYCNGDGKVSPSCVAEWKRQNAEATAPVKCPDCNGPIGQALCRTCDGKGEIYDYNRIGAESSIFADSTATD